MRKSNAWKMILLLPLLPLACNDSPTRPEGPHLLLRLSVSSTEPRVGEEVTFTLTARNTGTERLEILLNNGCQRNYVVVQEQEAVWDWSNTVVCTLSTVPLELDPGEARTYPITWGQRTEDGRQVPAGVYSVVGELQQGPPPWPRSPPVDFTIRP